MDIPKLWNTSALALRLRLSVRRIWLPRVKGVSVVAVTLFMMTPDHPNVEVVAPPPNTYVPEPYWMSAPPPPVTTMPPAALDVYTPFAAAPLPGPTFVPAALSVRPDGTGCGPTYSTLWSGAVMPVGVKL